MNWRDLRESFPQLQVGFCQGVCLPVYQSLAALCPALRPLQEGVEHNRDRWRQVADQSYGEEEEEEELGRGSDEEKSSEDGSDNIKVTRNL